MNAERESLLRRKARVRITNPVNGSSWEGRVISYADFPTIEIEMDGGHRLGLPQHFTVEELPVPDGQHPFRPDWTIAPGECLREWLKENGLSPEVAAARLGRAHKAAGVQAIRDVLDRKPLIEGHAWRLEHVTDVPARFWLNFEHNYRAGLAAGLTDASDT
jgi:plasmid maintenance system antidote protein VapI